MKIGVSESLAFTGQDVIIQNRKYDVSIIYADDRQPWMDRTSRRLNPHLVSTLEEGEHVLKLYKEFMNELSSPSSS
jgi:hypothetical protein